jgi:hypothetical protein
MTSREITSVALKCLAIYLLFTAIVAFPVLLPAVGRIDTLGWRIPAVLGSSLIIAAAGYFTWRIANSLIRTCRDTPTDQLHITFTPTQLEAILFRVLGVYFVVGYFRPFVKNIIAFRLDQSQGYGFSSTILDILIYLGVIILGMFLIAKPKAWVQLLKKLRRE